MMTARHPHPARRPFRWLMVAALVVLQALGPLLNSHFNGDGWEDEPSRVARSDGAASLLVHRAHALGLSPAQHAADAAPSVADQAVDRQADEIEFTRFVDLAATPSLAFERLMAQARRAEQAGSALRWASAPGWPGSPPEADDDPAEDEAPTHKLAWRARMSVDIDDDAGEEAERGDRAWPQRHNSTTHWFASAGFSALARPQVCEPRRWTPGRLAPSAARATAVRVAQTPPTGPPQHAAS